MAFYDGELEDQDYEKPWDRDADEALGYLFEPDWWPPSA